MRPGARGLGCAVLAIALVVVACASDGGVPDPRAAARAEAILDAFYAWDEETLGAAVQGVESAPAVLYYQGWAQAAHYAISNRRPCGGDGGRIVCRVTVTDDFGSALGYTATDTFTFHFEGDTLRSIEFEGDDPLVFTALFVWMTWDRNEVFENECAGMFAAGTTPAACARAVADAAETFSQRFGLD